MGVAYCRTERRDAGRMSAAVPAGDGRKFATGFVVTAVQ